LQLETRQPGRQAGRQESKPVFPIASQVDAENNAEQLTNCSATDHAQTARRDRKKEKWEDLCLPSSKQAGSEIKTEDASEMNEGNTAFS